MLCGMGSSAIRSNAKSTSCTLSCGLLRHAHPREQELFGFVVTGLMNKQIAGEMGISLITVRFTAKRHAKDACQVACGTGADGNALA